MNYENLSHFAGQRKPVCQTGKGKNFELPDVHAPPEVGQGDVPLSCFSPNTVNKCPFGSVLSVMVFHIFVLFLVDSLPKMAPKCGTDVLSNLPKHKMCLLKEIHASLLCSGMSCRAVGCEFGANELTI